MSDPERELSTARAEIEVLRKHVGELEARSARGAEIISRLEHRDALHLARAEQAEAQLANTKAELHHMYTFDSQHRGKIADLTAQLAVVRERADKLKAALRAVSEDAAFRNIHITFQMMTKTFLIEDDEAAARAALQQTAPATPLEEPIP